MKSRALFMAGCLFALGIASCGPKTETPATTDSSAVKPDTVMPAKPDSTPVAHDTATHADTMVLKSNDSLKHSDSTKKDGATGAKKETAKPGSSKSGGSKSSGTGTGATQSDESKPRRGTIMNTNPPNNGTGAVGESKPRR